MKRLLGKGKRGFAMLMVVLLVLGLVPYSPVEISAVDGTANTLTINMDVQKGTVRVDDGTGTPCVDTDGNDTNNVMIYELDSSKTYTITFSANDNTLTGGIVEDLYNVYDANGVVALTENTITLTNPGESFAYNVYFKSDLTEEMTVTYNTSEITSVVFGTGIRVEADVTVDNVTTMKYKVLPSESVSLTVDPASDDAVVEANIGQVGEKDGDTYTVTVPSGAEARNVVLTDNLIDLTVDCVNTVGTVKVYKKGTDSDAEVSLTNDKYTLTKGSSYYIELTSDLGLRKIALSEDLDIVDNQNGTYDIDLGTVAADAIDKTIRIEEKTLPKVTVDCAEDKVESIKLFDGENEITGTSSNGEWVFADLDEGKDYVVVIDPKDDDAEVTVENYTVTIDGEVGTKVSKIAIDDISTSVSLSASVVDIYTLDFGAVEGTINRVNSSGEVIDTATNGKLFVKENDTTVNLQIIPSAGRYVSSVQFGSDTADVVQLSDMNSAELSFNISKTISSDKTVVITCANIVNETKSINEVLNLAPAVTPLNNIYYVNADTILKSKTDGDKIVLLSNGLADNLVTSKTISADAEFTGVILLTEEGNLKIYNYTFDTAAKFVVDKDAPTVEKSDSDLEYFGPNFKTVDLSVKVTEEVGISKVVYFTSAKDLSTDEGKAEVLNATNVLTLNAENYEATVTIEDSVITNKTNQSYFIYAIDYAGNISEVEEIVAYYDEAGPNGGAITIEREKFNSFIGIAYVNNPTFEVNVSGVEDAGAGVKEIKIVLKNADGTQEIDTQTLVNGKATFNPIFVQGETYQIAIVAIDNVDNETTIAQATINEDFNEITYDMAAPVVTVTPKEESHTTGVYKLNDTKTYYISQNVFDDGFIFDILTTDNVSGLESATVTVNGDVISLDTDPMDGTSIDYEQSTQTVAESEYTINLKDLEVANVYVITVTSKDQAGNTSKPITYTVYVDNVSPTISSITVNDAVAQQGQFQSYGFFNKEKFDIKITATDGDNGELNSLIDYYVVDYLVGNTVVKTEKISATNSTVETQISDNFKGTIRVTACDKVGNSTVTTLANGLICVKPDTHTANAGVILTTPETSMKDVNGTQLYAENTTVNVVVTDTYAGIHKIEWSVVAPFDTANNASGSMTTDALASGWKAEATDNGVVTKVSGSIPVSNNSNDIVVKVTITDNAGNTTTKNLVLSIDKTTPVISVSVTGDDADAQYTSTFNGDRVATITITERNFNANDVNVVITNTDQVIPSVTTWTKAENTVNPDGNTYTATVTFAADGDYTLDVAYTDLAKRTAIAPAQQTLTIDKTLPVASVGIDGNAVNGFYYASGRTATIVIEEHNFDPSRVQLTGIATNDGATVSIPSIGSWSSSGNTHAVSVHFSADADYQLVLTGVDKAGNTFTYEVPNFVIDQQVPEISITGIEDQSANAGDVIPVITLGDVNYDTNGVNITLVGANNGPMELDGAFSDSANGQVFTFNNFPNEQSYDDIYTLTATKTDMAGNETTETITFSVNRFGSVYTFSDELKEVVGKYVKEPFTIVLTETNIDRLDPATIKVVLTINGTPKTLVLDVDYTITETGSDASWKQYVYSINTSAFEGDGSYSLALYSVDAANNVNENINEVKEAEIIFGIDATAPIIEAINFEDGFTNETAFTATISAIDNIILSSVKVMIDGKEVEVIEDNGMYSFTIPESSSRQTIVVTATDAAGNVTTMEYANILVTSNPFISFINNTPLLIGSIAGVAAVGGGTGAFVFFRKRNVIKVKK